MVARPAGVEPTIFRVGVENVIHCTTAARNPCIIAHGRAKGKKNIDEERIFRSSGRFPEGGIGVIPCAGGFLPKRQRRFYFARRLYGGVPTRLFVGGFPGRERRRIARSS